LLASVAYASIHGEYLLNLKDFNAILASKNEDTISCNAKLWQEVSIENAHKVQQANAK